jgi:hypothetical protein
MVLAVDLPLHGTPAPRAHPHLSNIGATGGRQEGEALTLPTLPRRLARAGAVRADSVEPAPSSSSVARAVCLLAQRTADGGSCSLSAMHTSA